MVAKSRLRAVLASLLSGLMGLGPLAPLQAAEQLQIRFDGLDLPLNLQELEQWNAQPERSVGELARWLSLLDPASQLQLRQLLRAPLVKERSFTQQLLRSWAGRRVAEELGVLISTENGNAGPLMLSTLNGLLKQQQQVTTLELLRAVPAQQLNINLDGLQRLASRWRQQLDQQKQALAALQSLPLAPRTPLLPLSDGVLLERGSSLSLQAPRSAPSLRRLRVVHRLEPLELEIWSAPAAQPWILLMPGLGGSASQLRWLAQALHQRGWSVVLLDHPGSNEQAVRELLQGRRLPPGAETLRGRVLDVQAVVAAVQAGSLPRLGDQVVLMGHSLGGVSALLAVGLRPEPGLVRRCKRALADLPLINVSRLLQCQLPEVPLPAPQPLAQPVAALVSFNGFGSLLWPNRGLRGLQAPALLVGGSLDLITPPVSEQLRLFVPDANPSSRLVLIEGASHFSPVRIQGGEQQPLFRFGEELVGVDPARVQALILSLTSEFLQGLALPEGSRELPPQRRRLGGVSAYVLDQSLARQWLREVSARSSPVDPEAPPADPPAR
ncbi:alpha/beta hydrolase [Vulcanococcus sp.]|uniref:alpha/beta hydrolase n=1 Tax=Vulcanococcus sp. TaxID=2856995 RepID=UPI003C755EDA